MKIVTGIVLLLGLCASVPAQQAKPCGGLDALVGEWVGTGTGSPGQGSGGFTFQRELQGKVVVRRNFAEYPESKERPAFRHDDLMVVYGDATARRADYWDNEGHLIRYAVSTSADGCNVTFESAGSATDAAFKLVYTFVSADEVSLDFLIAPPGKDFAKYITATAKRKH